MKYEPHPLALMFPRPDAADSRQIRDDILKHGLRVPVVLFEGKILDGLTRHTVCCELRKKLRFTYFDGTSREALELVTSLNLCRRHLTPSQKAAIGVDILKRLQADGVSRPEAIKSAALETKTSEGSIRRLEAVQARSPKLLERVRNGDMSIAGAENKITRKPDGELARSHLLSAVAQVRRALGHMQGAPRQQRRTLDSAIADIESVIESDWINED